MAKNKWDQLWYDLDKRYGELVNIPNPTAEQCGMCQAYNYVYARMRTLEALEKKLDKA